jgi:hypothetical protein
MSESQIASGSICRDEPKCPGGSRKELEGNKDFYNQVILPRLIEFAIRQKYLEPFRQHAAGRARGRVLEVGVGPGVNLSSHGETANTVYGVDPSRELPRE